MRIVGGRNRGQKFVIPKNVPVRPTMDFVKESLFNILNNLIEINNIVVTDLFAGSGNISYEFLSRGAKEIRSVERNNRCCTHIKKTSTLFEASAITVYKQDVMGFLQTNGLPSADIVFADPPYDLDYESLKKLIGLAILNKNLKQGGYFILEHSKHNDFSGEERLINTKKYGDTVLSFFS